MKKILIYLLSVIFLFGLFQDINLVRASLILLALVSMFLISRAPSRYVAAAKYPVIILSFAITVALFFFPHTTLSDPLSLAVSALSFYALAFYLVTMDERDRGFSKEAAALSFLFLSTSFNTAMAGKAVFIPSTAVATMFFLYITGRIRLVPFIAGYGALVVGLLISKGVPIFGSGPVFQEVHRYLVLGGALLLLVLSFLRFVGKGDPLRVLSFFGFLYLATDALMTMGLKVSGGLLYQPVLALVVVSPLMGILLKAQGGRP